MSCQKDEDHGYPAHHDGQTGGHVDGQRIEHSTKHSSCESESEQADIAQQVSQQACSHTIGGPYAPADIAKQAQQRSAITAWRIVEEDAQGRYANQHHQNGLQYLRQLHATSWQSIEDDRQDDGRHPTEGSYAISKAIVLDSLAALEYHAQQHLYETDDDRENHHGRIAEDGPHTIVIKEIGLHRSQEGPVLLTEVDAEECAHEQTADDSHHAQPCHEAAIVADVSLAELYNCQSSEEYEQAITSIAQT